MPGVLRQGLTAFKNAYIIPLVLNLSKDVWQPKCPMQPNAAHSVMSLNRRT